MKVRMRALGYHTEMIHLLTWNRIQNKKKPLQDYKGFNVAILEESNS